MTCSKYYGINATQFLKEFTNINTDSQKHINNYKIVGDDTSYPKIQ